MLQIPESQSSYKHLNISGIKSESLNHTARMSVLFSIGLYNFPNARFYCGEPYFHNTEHVP